MIQKMFGVYDLKACAYLQPFFSINAGSAIRAFSDAANDGKSPIAVHPSDYQLFELGSFDDATGVLLPAAQQKLLCLASDFVSEKIPSFVAPDGLYADLSKELKNGSQKVG